MVVAVRVWAPLLARRRFILFYDNEAAVTVINCDITHDRFIKRFFFASTLVHSLLKPFRDSSVI